MAEKCPNCSQRILATDSACWHCGYALEGGAETAVSAPEEQISPQLTEEDDEPISISAISVYAGLTAFIIIAILLTMRALGQQPVVYQYPNTNINLGWSPVTDGAQTFTFDLPPEWEVFTRDQDESVFTTLLTDNPTLEAAQAPFSVKLPDFETVAVGVEEIDNQQIFFTVAQSQLLGELSWEEIAPLIRDEEDDVAIFDSERFQSYFGDERVRIEMLLTSEPDELACEQQIVYGGTVGYLLVTCSPDRITGRYEDLYLDLLTSFQLLVQR